MTSLLIAGAFVWLTLLTFALIGHNYRLTLLRAALSDAQLGSNEFEPGEQSPFVGLPGLPQPDSAVLIVSETCSSCVLAIQELERIAKGKKRPISGEFVVLTPDEGDERVHEPLRRLKDDELYRSLYPGATPAIFLVNEVGLPQFLGTVVQPRDVSVLLRKASRRTSRRRTAPT